MNSDEIRMFRLMLKRDYSFLVYKVEDLKQEIELLYDKMGGIKSIDYTKVKGTTNQEAIEQYKLSISEDIAFIEKELMIYEERLRKIDDVLNQLDDCHKEMFRLKYLKHKTYYEIGKIYYLSPSAVNKRMTRVLEDLWRTKTSMIYVR